MSIAAMLLSWAMAHHYQLPYIASFANPFANRFTNAFADFTPSKRDALIYIYVNKYLHQVNAFQLIGDALLILSAINSRQNISLTIVPDQ